MRESPFAIANFFLKKAKETNTPMSPMKLIKMVYIAHGWHLALANEPLIGEPIQAWKYGPVIESLYHAYKIFGNGNITFPVSATSVASPEHLDPFLNRIWEVYSKFSGGQLSTMTHQPNTPWDIVWNQKGGSTQRSALIPEETIKEHYLERRKANVGG